MVNSVDLVYSFDFFEEEELHNFVLKNFSVIIQGNKLTSYFSARSIKNSS